MVYSFDTVIEAIAVVLALIFLILLIKENIWCWSFGIISSLLSIYIFIQVKLYSESLLHTFYVLFGIYGWYIWKKHKSKLSITVWTIKTHLIWIGFGLICSFALGYFFYAFTDAYYPFADSFTTIFSLIATYLEVKKKLSAWVFWFMLNIVTIVLYYSRGLEIYMGLMVIYTVFSVLGWIIWYKKYQKTKYTVQTE